ncbi:hypothetical protein [Thermococcus sp. Bubb.Bath]|uniref:hypothetical protein n=1 Tax=Thermococcus sp. Bubb.Bath TaxID=1638242 RepID=UPI00143B5B39|nr:hypothetical protein [Thermococcus sp. Bubb.Bath]NJF24717.1 hypothetical protein [Thermococcus sp. Bubb.Bath]
MDQLEENLIGKAKALLRTENGYSGHLQALGILAGILAYRETGILISGPEAVKFIEMRFPEAMELVSPLKSPVTKPGEEDVGTLQKSAKKFLGIISGGTRE